MSLDSAPSSDSDEPDAGLKPPQTGNTAEDSGVFSSRRETFSPVDTKEVTSSSQTGDGHDPSSGFLEAVPPSKDNWSDIPDGFEIYVVRLEKKTSDSLGISLIPCGDEFLIGVFKVSTLSLTHSLPPSSFTSFIPYSPPFPLISLLPSFLPYLSPCFIPIPSSYVLPSFLTPSFLLHSFLPSLILQSIRPSLPCIYNMSVIYPTSTFYLFLDTPPIIGKCL